MQPRTIAALLLTGLLASCAPAPVATAAPPTGNTFEPSYVAGTRDTAGHFMGGTELRNFAVHNGKLYAGLGYWEDGPGFEGPQGATVLVLDRPTASWRVDHVFDARMRDFLGRAVPGMVASAGPQLTTRAAPTPCRTRAANSQPKDGAVAASLRQ